MPIGTGAGQGPVTRDFRYQADAIVEELLTDATHTSAPVRSYVVDESGSVVRMTIASGEPGAGTYVPLWNGHGDAVALHKLDPATGTLTLANSYRYETFGRPTTTTHNSSPDLGFRFLYVGEFDVQWDNELGLGPLYMHARHYSPSLGRFLQPDPDGTCFRRGGVATPLYSWYEDRRLGPRRSVCPGGPPREALAPLAERGVQRRPP